LEAKKNGETRITATEKTATQASVAEGEPPQAVPVREIDPIDLQSIAKPASYTWSLTQAVITNAIFFLFADICVKDMGEIQRAVMIASVPFWLMVYLIIYRNPHTPSIWAMLFIRWGLIPIIIGGVFLLNVYAHSVIEFRGFK
jgi:hypothetical protein